MEGDEGDLPSGSFFPDQGVRGFVLAMAPPSARGLSVDPFITLQEILADLREQTPIFPYPGIKFQKVPNIQIPAPLRDEDEITFREDEPFLEREEPVPYMLPLDVASGRTGFVLADVTYGYINSAHNAVNPLTVSVSETGAFSVNQDGTITNAFGQVVGNTQSAPTAAPEAQGPAPGEID